MSVVSAINYTLPISIGRSAVNLIHRVVMAASALALVAQICRGVYMEAMFRVTVCVVESAQLDVNEYIRSFLDNQRNVYYDYVI